MAGELAWDAEREAVRIAGRWTIASASAIAAETARQPVARARRIDGTDLERIDTAGATLLLRILRAAGLGLDALDDAGMRAEDAALVRMVADRGAAPVEPAQPHHSLRELLDRLGRGTAHVWHDTIELLGFVGLTLATLFDVARGRKRLRVTATVFHMEQTGLDAVPIVALLSFLVGAVVAFLGATVLRDFGAEIFTVELISYSFLREFGVLLTAILLAGRSGSAFTAQLGSMKSREELDAIRAIGLDAMELLVVPRVLALLVMLPVLGFLAMLSGIVGGALVGSMSLDITPGMFVSRLYEMTEVRHFWVGMIKAPVFAFLIGVIGCLEGFKVEGSAESVGRHTTSSVVQAIFLVIVADALFAIFFMEVGL